MRMLVLLIVLGVLSLWHIINALVYIWAWADRQLCHSDRAIVGYLLFVSVVTIGVLLWTVVELFPLVWRMAVE